MSGYKEIGVIIESPTKRIFTFIACDTVLLFKNEVVIQQTSYLTTEHLFITFIVKSFPEEIIYRVEKPEEISRMRCICFCDLKAKSKQTKNIDE